MKRHPKLDGWSGLGDFVVEWLTRQRLFWPLVGVMVLGIVVLWGAG